MNIGDTPGKASEDTFLAKLSSEVRCRDLSQINSLPLGDALRIKAGTSAALPLSQTNDRVLKRLGDAEEAPYKIGEPVDRHFRSRWLHRSRDQGSRLRCHP